ncbi:MAG: 3',5'-cyclic-AMP phosphodiesterase [Candidatus Sedimenticola sp. (ex Thyasira tokunagai)]
MQHDDTLRDNQHRQPPLKGDELPLRVIQITDSHLYADPEKCLAGINTQQSFTQVLDSALQKFTKPDLILATGDLVHDASEAGYTWMGKQFEKAGIPTHCLAGNHDDSSMMASTMTAANISSPKAVKRGNWLLLLLDSSLPNHPGGHLNDSELSILQRSLENHPNHHVLICLHHHPVPMGSRWLDDISLDNPASLFNITDHHTNVRGVLWGHVHQHFDGERNGVKLMSTPSTCIQFTRKRDEFSIEASPPGYRWLELMPNGEITGGVERLDELPQGLDVESSGY